MMKLAWWVKSYEEDEWTIKFTEPMNFSYFYAVCPIVWAEVSEE